MKRSTLSALPRAWITTATQRAWPKLCGARAAGYRNLFYATLGTGIGTGIIIDRKIYHGRTGSAAEGGHVSIDYKARSAPAGNGAASRRWLQGRESRPRQRETCGRAWNRAFWRTPAQSAHVQPSMWPRLPGRRRAWLAKCWSETAFLLTVWLGNIVDLLEPDAIVLGGGVAELMCSFFAGMSANLPHWVQNQRAKEIPLVLARYGADAGIAGAAALCR